MSYTAITNAEIEVGQPVKKELFQKIKDNMDSFNTDIENLKQTGIIDIMNVRFSGSIEQYSSSEVANRIPIFKAPVSASIVSVVATLITASSSGTLSFALDKSTDNGVNWTPLLSSDVQLTGTSVGSLSGSVNWVDVPSQSFDQGDLIKLRITGVQSSQGNFHIHIYGEVA